MFPLIYFYNIYKNKLMENISSIPKYLQHVKKNEMEGHILPSEYGRIIHKYAIKKNKDRKGNKEIKNK